MGISLAAFYIVGVSATFVVGILTYHFSRYFKWRIPQWVFCVMMIFPVYIFFAQYLKYQNLHFYIDFSHWMQLLHNIVTTGKPISLSAEFQVLGTANYLSAHFVPLIYALSLPFKLLPRAETLIILNVLLMVSSAIPIYKLSLRAGGSRYFGLFMAVLLLWYPTFQYITLYEFEMLRFSIPILLWVLYFWEARKTALFFLFVLFAVLVREEVGLTIFMFGSYLLFVKKERVKGFIAAILGLGAFAIILQVIMPSLRGAEFAHIAADMFSRFGSTPVEIIIGVASNPGAFLSVILHPIKLANLGMLFIPLLLIPLLAPLVLISVLANIGVGLISNSLAHTSYMLYYIAPSIPFIFYAFIKAWPKLTRSVIASETKRSSTLADRDCRGLRPRNDKIEYAIMTAVLSGLLVSNVFFGPSPISLQFWFKDIQPAPFRTQNFHWSGYQVMKHHRKVEQFVRLIPNDSVVSASQFLQPRLFMKKGVMAFPQVESQEGRWRADYVFIDRTNNRLKSESPAYIGSEKIDAVVKSEDWAFVAGDDGYELYKRVHK